MAPGTRRTACPERRKRVPRRRPRVSTAGAHQTRKGHGPEDAGAGRPRASRAMLGGDARRLQPGGRAHRKTRPDAEPHREGTRREARRPAGLAQRQNGRGGPTVRLSLERGARLRAENGPRTYRTHIHRSFNWGNGAPGVHGGRGGVRLAAGTDYLRSVFG